MVLADCIVPVDKDTRIGGIIADREVVRLVCATTTKTILVSHGGGCGLVEDTLIEVVAHFDQIIEEGCCGVVRNVRVRKARSVVVAGGTLDQSKKLEPKGQRV